MSEFSSLQKWLMRLLIFMGISNTLSMHLPSSGASDVLPIIETPPKTTYHHDIDLNCPPKIRNSLETCQKSSENRENALSTMEPHRFPSAPEQIQSSGRRWQPTLPLLKNLDGGLDSSPSVVYPPGSSEASTPHLWPQKLWLHRWKTSAATATSSSEPQTQSTQDFAALFHGGMSTHRFSHTPGVQNENSAYGDKFCKEQAYGHKGENALVSSKVNLFESIPDPTLLSSSKSDREKAVDRENFPNFPSQKPSHKIDLPDLNEDASSGDLGDGETSHPQKSFEYSQDQNSGGVKRKSVLVHDKEKLKKCCMESPENRADTGGQAATARDVLAGDYGQSIKSLPEASLRESVYNENFSPHEGGVHIALIHVNSRMLVTFLVNEGKLGVANTDTLFEEMEHWFNGLDFDKESASNYDIEYIEIRTWLAKHYALNQMVVGFLGGLKIILHGSSSQLPEETLLRQGWKFIMDYMESRKEVIIKTLSNIPTGEILKENEALRAPQGFYGCFSRTNETGTIGPGLILELLQKWSQSNSGAPDMEGILYDRNSFIRTCIKVRTERLGADSIANKKYLEHREYQAILDIEKIATGGKKGSDRLEKNEDDPRFSDFLVSQGNSELNKISAVKVPVQKFFQDFKKTLPETLRLAICRIEKRIVPAFIGSLKLIYDHQKSNSDLVPILLNGWEYLEKYFSRLRSHISTIDDSRGVSDSQLLKVPRAIETLSPRGLVHSLSAVAESRAVFRWIWAFLQQWYDPFFCQWSRNSHQLEFGIKPFHKEDLKEMFDKLKVKTQRSRGLKGLAARGADGLR